MILKSSLTTKVATKFEEEGLEGFLEGSEARRWGMLLHTALLLLEGTDEDDVKVAVNRAFCLLLERRDESKIARAVEEIKGVLSVSGIEIIFPKEKGRILAERSFLDDDGNILRPDRVVVYPGKAVVVDFKSQRPSSGEILEKYKNQVKNYVRIVSKVLGKPVEGYLLFIKEAHLEMVDKWEK